MSVVDKPQPVADEKSNFKRFSKKERRRIRRMLEDLYCEGNECRLAVIPGQTFDIVHVTITPDLIEDYNLKAVQVGEYISGKIKSVKIGGVYSGI